MIGEAEGEGNADGEQEVSIGEAGDTVEDTRENGIGMADQEEENKEDRGEDVYLPRRAKDPGEGKANRAHDDVGGFALEFG